MGTLPCHELLQPKIDAIISLVSIHHTYSLQTLILIPHD